MLVYQRVQWDMMDKMGLSLAKPWTMGISCDFESTNRNVFDRKTTVN